MRRIRALWTGAGGNSLPMAMVTLMIGTLLVTPLLHFAGARQSADLRYARTIAEQHAAEAGLEYVLWRLVREPELREAINAARPSLDIDPPAAVNEMDLTLQAAPVRRTFSHTLWGNSETCSSVMDWTGAHNRLVGNAHSNRGIRIKGGSTHIEGIVEYVTDMDAGNNITFVPPPPNNPVKTVAADFPEQFFLSDYDDPTRLGTPAYYAAQRGEYHYIDGDLQINQSGYEFNGLYFITGDLKINGNSFSGAATFVTLGTIEMIGSGYNLRPYVDSLSLYSAASFTGSARCTNPAIRVTGSGITQLGGYVYAPDGLIRVSGSGGLAGAFLGDSVDISGQGLTVQPPPQGDEDEGCGTFDIRSTAGDTTVTARVRYCEDAGLSILSWLVE
ncbi:MAG TPA: hypothetical protein GX702_14215 [Chloroflexi bacterium]|nr:hypothetical protein [Chloroflexota bacterium]